MKLTTQALTIAFATLAAVLSVGAIALRPAAHPQKIVQLERVLITGKRMHAVHLPRVVIEGHSTHTTQLA